MIEEDTLFDSINRESMELAYKVFDLMLTRERFCDHGIIIQFSDDH